jgi:hypothetical protein
VETGGGNEDDRVTEDRIERTLHPRDRRVVCYTHFLAMVPFFGILAAAIIILAYQERSRTIVFHARQAIIGQAVVLLLFVILSIVGLLGALVGVLVKDQPALRALVVRFDKAMWYALGVAYLAWCCWCFYFAWMSLDGRDLEYPWIGARLRGRSE